MLSDLPAGDGLTVDVPAARYGYLHVVSGRVRAGYAIGDLLFAQADANKPKALLHIIGERPGSGHHNYSVYIAAPKADVWAQKKVDHDIVRVVSGISDTGTTPVKGANLTVKILKGMIWAFAILFSMQAVSLTLRSILSLAGREVEPNYQDEGAA